MEIKHGLGHDKFSLRIYESATYFDTYNPQALFDKWAALEVSAYHDLPAGMEMLTVPEGQYAVFIHKGPASAAPATFGYIFAEWLPQSGHQLDNRPHFEILGDTYIHDSPLSEEEIWVPIKG
jgi:AraC family transcriptional regulator